MKKHCQCINAGITINNVASLWSGRSELTTNDLRSPTFDPLLDPLMSAGRLWD